MTSASIRLVRITPGAIEKEQKKVSQIVEKKLIAYVCIAVIVTLGIGYPKNLAVSAAAQALNLNRDDRTSTELKGFINLIFSAIIAIPWGLIVMRVSEQQKESQQLKLLACINVFSYSTRTDTIEQLKSYVETNKTSINFRIEAGQDSYEAILLLTLRNLMPGDDLNLDQDKLCALLVTFVDNSGRKCCTYRLARVDDLQAYAKSDQNGLCKLMFNPQIRVPLDLLLIALDDIVGNHQK
jgi:hypothetical protein